MNRFIGWLANQVGQSRAADIWPNITDTTADWCKQVSAECFLWNMAYCYRIEGETMAEAYGHMLAVHTGDRQGQRR